MTWRPLTSTNPPTSPPVSSGAGSVVGATGVELSPPQDTEVAASDAAISTAIVHVRTRVIVDVIALTP